MKSVTITAIVPVRNEAATLRETAQTILDQRFPETLEVLFVDGDSVDGTREVLDELQREDSRVRVLDNPQRQLGTAFNIGLRHAHGEFVAKMDAHTYFKPDYLVQGVERLRLGDTGWVTGPQVPYGVSTWSRRVALALDSPLGVGGSSKWMSLDDEGSASEWELDTGVFSGIWPRELLERIGGWDEGWPVNGDAEMASRYLKQGGRIICLRAMGAQYIPRGSLRGLARQYFRYGFYRAKTGRRHPESLRPSHLLSPALVVVALANLAPGSLGRIARTLLVFYGLVIAVAGLRAGTTTAAADRVGVTTVFATMHFSWGLGFLAGSVRFGPPLPGVTGVLRRLVLSIIPWAEEARASPPRPPQARP